MHSPLRFVGDIAWKRRPVQLTFFVTKMCNAACPFCFYLQSKGEAALSKVGPSEVDSGELTFPEIERISSSLGPLLWLAFSGGEVFLREDIVEITETFYRNNRPSFLLYSTNGLQPETIRLATEEILRRCPRSTVTVKLSLDGVGDEHDRLRGVPGAFERVMETHRLLAELLEDHANFELGINTVFCALNQDRIGDVFAHVRGMEGMRTHTLSMIRGDLRDETLKEADLKKYEEAVEKMEEDLRARTAPRYRFTGARLKAAQDILQRRLIRRTLSEDRRIIPCYAGTLNLVLTETGDVYPCELFPERLGRVREHGLDMHRLLRTPDAKRILRRAADHRSCHCTHECYFITNILFNPRLYPALLNQYLRL